VPNSDRTVVCREAIKTKQLAEKNVERWWRLIYAFGAALTAFGIILLLAILKGDNTQRAVTAAVFVADSLITGFVVVQKNSAQKRLKEAISNLKPSCGTQRVHGAAEDVVIPGVIPEAVLDVLAPSTN
jgi:hypothetical protein